MPRYALKAEIDGPLPIDGAALHIIKALKREPRMMRYELTDYEWAAMADVAEQGARRASCGRSTCVLNGICWVLRSGAPWRYLPFRPVAKGRCVGRIMDALAPLMMRPSK